MNRNNVNDKKKPPLEALGTTAQQIETPPTSEIEKPEICDQRIVGLWAWTLLLRMFLGCSSFLRLAEFGRRFWREIASRWPLLLRSCGEAGPNYGFLLLALCEAEENEIVMNKELSG